MINKLLPIGTVLENNEGVKFIINSYGLRDNGKIFYYCISYPISNIADHVPPKKYEEFKTKYNLNDKFIELDLNNDYKTVFEGYKGDNFDKFVSIAIEEKMI